MDVESDVRYKDGHLGLKSLYVDNEGNVKDRYSPRLYNHQKRIVELNRSLSSKRNSGSKRRNKVKKHLSKVHRKLKNSRRDFLHKASVDFNTDV